MSDGSVTLKIVLKQGEPINVSGPLQDKLVCLGMLELAKAAILSYEPSAIVPAAVIPRLIQ